MESVRRLLLDSLERLVWVSILVGRWVGSQGGMCVGGHACCWNCLLPFHQAQMNQCSKQVQSPVRRCPF